MRTHLVRVVFVEFADTCRMLERIGAGGGDAVERGGAGDGSGANGERDGNGGARRAKSRSVVGAGEWAGSAEQSDGDFGDV